MEDFNYLKKAIKKKQKTLQFVAQSCGMTKGYLSQLVNNKIKRPSAHKLQILHRYLQLEYPLVKKKIGVVFGQFAPLHTGHIDLIQRAISQADEIYIIVCADSKRDEAQFLDSEMSRRPTINDRIRWLLQTFKYQKNIFIEILDENGIPTYPDGWQQWSERVKKLFKTKGIVPDYVYTNKPQDVQMYKEILDLETILIDPDKDFLNIDSDQIRKSPLKYWQYIPTEVRPFFVKKVAILGGESSGKSTLINKLANVFNTTSAWEFGREYVFTHLGGDERALQYSDYDKIALGQAQYIDFAVKHANRVTFIDTDFVTTQAFCKKYEGKEHPFVQAMIKNYRFDLVILLENNTPWVADGLRHLGSLSQRRDFQQLIIKLLIKNKIDFVKIDSPNYDERYLQSVKLVRKLINPFDKA